MVVDTGGVHRAAAVLNATQSTVSAHLRRLERATGHPIVVRVGRGIALTDHGEAVARHARRIVNAHEEAIADLCVAAPAVLRFGTSEHYAELALAQVAHTLTADGGVPYEVRYRIGRSREIARSVGFDLEAGLYLGAQGDDVPPTAVVVGMVAMRWWAIEGLEIGDAGATEPIPLVTFDMPCVSRDLAVSALRGAGQSFQIAAESSNLAGVHTAIRAGVGLALLPDGYAMDGVRQQHQLPPAADAALILDFSSRVPAAVQGAMVARLRAALALDDSRTGALDRPDAR